MNKKYSVTEKIHVFQMESAWFYIPVPLSKIPKVPRGGWGSVPILATIGKTSWQTSIFPMKKDHYFIPLKKIIRTKENIYEGNRVKITYIYSPRK